MSGIIRATLSLFAGTIAFASPGADSHASSTNCSFQAAPDAYLSAQSRIRQDVNLRTTKLVQALANATHTATPIPHRNFIDDEIFNTMAQQSVQPATLTTDEEFFRRINLDLTGRIPTSDEVRSFVADTDTSKRDKAIENLLYSDAFNAKWTMWYGDLVQNNATQSTAAVTRQIQGRNAFYNTIYWWIAGWTSLRDMAYLSVSGTGNNYDNATGHANFIMGGSVAGGPIQDTYDGMLVRSVTSFLGQGNYDCLLCHDGRGHLDQINLWGSQTGRQQAESMAAFFARTQLTRYPAPTPPPGQTSSDPYYLSTIVEDLNNTAAYNLNTNYGNRPNRVPYGTLKSLTPIYQFTYKMPADSGWRSAFAENMVDDPMFSINMANRLWKAMFNLGLVDPVDQLDPARLDPKNPPPSPWTFQATHPALLVKLSQWMTQNNWDLRGYLRLLAQSNAYQLSSRYAGDWDVQSVPLFARHYPRRLEGEEVHDAVAKATGVFNRYTVQGFADPFQWAMLLPEPVEPRSNGAVLSFMNSFLRGNRDTTQRNQASSILQQLNLMNDNYVVSRTKVTASPQLLAISKIADNNAALEELFLTFLSREPTAFERSHALVYLQQATTAAARNTAIEDLAWSLINKLDFLFSY